MIRDKIKFLSQGILAAGMALLAACGGDDSTTVNIIDSAPSGIITGRVIDSSTMQPVTNAEVVLIANGEKKTTRSNASADPDLAGTFVFHGVSATAEYGGHTLKISAPGFAILQMIIGVPQESGDEPVTRALGDIRLSRGFDLTVIATDNGVPVSGITISALPNGWFGMAVSAVTDTGGAAILAGLSQETQYTVASAPFYDASGNLKYIASSIGSISYGSLNTSTVSLPLQAVVRQEEIEIVASNLLSDGSETYSYPYTNLRVITPEQVIRIVFNYPVTLADTVTASYVNDLVDASDPDYGEVVTVPTISASLDATGTILTIVNSAEYRKNHSYTFNGTFKAEIDGREQFFSLGTVSSSPYFANSIYVADNTATGLSALSSVAADNFNGTSATSATTTPALVYLVFPEGVSGSYTILGTKNGSTVTTVNELPVHFHLAYGSMLYASNAGGADPAPVFRLPINIYLADDSAAEINELTINLQVHDAEGNIFSKVVKLPVQ